MQLINRTGQSENEGERKLVKKLGILIDDAQLEKQAVHLISLVREAYLLGRQTAQNGTRVIILSDMYPLLDDLIEKYR